MTIAIAGDGLCGSYLYRRLVNKGVTDVQVYGLWKHPTNRCKITSCGWGAAREIESYIRLAGFHPADYILDYISTMDFEDVPIKIDMVIFDKPRLIGDLLGDHIPHRFVVERKTSTTVIDATGLARVYLPKIGDDLIAQCAQMRRPLKVASHGKVHIRFMKDGYSWVFPLGDGTAHIGYGGIMGDGKSKLPLSDLEVSPLYRQLIDPTTGIQSLPVCACHGAVRIGSPSKCLPFHVKWELSTNGDRWIIGVGEAIGAVAPITGEGNVPGLKTCELLLDRWDDPVGYTDAVLKEFSWMNQERELIDKMRQGYKPSMNDVRIIQKNAKRMGISFNTHSVMSMCAKFMTG